jgi:hypothetical protein
MINIEDYAGEPGIELGIISAYLKKNSSELEICSTLLEKHNQNVFNLHLFLKEK